MADNKFTEAKLEQAITALFEAQGFTHVDGKTFKQANRGESNTYSRSNVLIPDDLRRFLAQRYAADNITDGEIDSIIQRLSSLPASDLYESNRKFCKMLSDGFTLPREDSSQQDLYIYLVDYHNVLQQLLPNIVQSAAQRKADNSAAALALNHESEPLAVAEPKVTYLANSRGFDSNIYTLVTQREIEGIDGEKRIPDAIVYINGLPLVVCEFKSTIREQASLANAYEQLTVRYQRDIPALFVFNAFCMISDGVNSKMGGLFSPYEFFYAWRKITGNETQEANGITSLHSMMQGLFDKARLRDVIRHFIFFPDSSKTELKIVCRYPQYYATRKLYQSIKIARKGVINPDGSVGDGKGGTYFGATGCGKSYIMQFLARLLMKSVEFESPTIVLITDRTDLDDQLAQQFGQAKTYIGDQSIVAVQSREHLRELLQGRNSGGVFLTTIHKFTEDTQLLTARNNVICISDEAHRSQTNLDQKLKLISDGPNRGVRKTYGFAKYLHDTLPNATYVGFTGTPIDATLTVFGEIIDSYTMTESVNDQITVRIVYEGRAAKIILDNSKLEDIENYYQQCAENGSSEHHIDASKKASANMNAILGDPDRIRALANDFVAHYQARIDEGSTIKGKAIFVSSSRTIAYQLYQELQTLRPEWFDIKAAENSAQYHADEQQNAMRAGKLAKPMARVKLVMTRGQDDSKALWELLGSKEYRKDLDTQFKNEHSNFKIAIVVDMWLTGFDVPCLDTIYIDKPVQRHNLIQTISRVNRKFDTKDKGLVVDYIGIKTQMDKALATYSKTDESNFEDISESVTVVKDHLDLLATLLHDFDETAYFTGNALVQLDCLNQAVEFVYGKPSRQQRFMALVKRLKAAYNVCCGSEMLSQTERDYLHFYLAVRSVIFKQTQGDAPDTEQMNRKVRELVAEALKSSGVEEVFKLGQGEGGVDIFDDDYLAKISKVKLPNTKIQLLQQLLAKAIGEFKQVNKLKAIDFSQRFKSLVDKYNERREEMLLVGGVHEEFTVEVLRILEELKVEMNSFEGMGINFEEKAFYDILHALTQRYDFTYPEEQLLELAKAVKVLVDEKTSVVDWHRRDDIKAQMKVGLIKLLLAFKYPPVDHQEVYKEVFEQAENFKKHRTA